MANVEIERAEQLSDQGERMQQEETNSDTRPVRSQELQNIRIMVDAGDRGTFVIPLQRHHHLAPLNGGSPPHATTIVVARPDAAAAEEDRYLDGMRGWIMTVAALFATLSFEAINQWPRWLPDPEDGWKSFWAADHAKEGIAWRAILYVFLNTMTFSLSLSVVAVMLLQPRSWLSVSMTNVSHLMVALGCTVVASFPLMISKKLQIMGFAYIVMAAYIVVAVLVWFVRRKPIITRRPTDQRDNSN